MNNARREGEPAEQTGAEAGTRLDASSGTAAPCPPNFRAVASPIPSAATVTMATFPLKASLSHMILSFLNMTDDLEGGLSADG